MEDEIGPASQELIARLWQEEWGLPVVTAEQQYMPMDVEGLAWRAGDGNEIGLVTWAVDGDRAEIVSVQALEPGRRIGSRLMDAAEEELRRRGVKTVHLVTTNDNHRALSVLRAPRLSACPSSPGRDGPRSLGETAGTAHRRRRHPPTGYVGAGARALKGPGDLPMPFSAGP